MVLPFLLNATDIDDYGLKAAARRRCSWRSFESVEFAKLERVDWFDNAAASNASGISSQKAQKPTATRPWKLKTSPRY